MPFEIFYGSRFGFNYRGILRLFFMELMVASGALQHEVSGRSMKNERAAPPMTPSTCVHLWLYLLG